MRWKGRRQSRNMVDSRSRRPGPRATLGGGVGIVVIALVVWLLGGNPLQVLQSGAVAPPGSTGVTAPAASAAEDELAAFVSVVLADTEDVWREILPAQADTPYVEPTLELFRDGVHSGCGFASAAVGPFYCGADERIYIDLGFYDQLRDRFGAPGDFAQAYVIAHEVGHHVQHLLGISQRVHELQQRSSEEEANRLSVRLELQADFLAGVWAHHAERTKQILERGDIDEAIRAAAAIGDDTIQRRAQGYVVPDAFTHGSAEQRVRWFRRGLETGDLNQGNTFDEPWSSL